MSHYSEFEDKKVQELNKLKRNKNKGKSKLTQLIESRQENFYQDDDNSLWKTEVYNNNYEDYDVYSDMEVAKSWTEFNPIDTMVELTNYKTIKETKGKPAGARWCYIDKISNNYLGVLINELVYLIESKNDLHIILINIKELEQELFRQIEDKELLINELIKIREQAVSSGKYSKEGYKSIINPELLLDAIARHYIKLVYIGPLDKESGCLHLAHILANLIMIQYQLENYYE